MPYDAHENVLRRDLSIAAAKPIIEIASLLLQEVVNFSTFAYIRCMNPSRAYEKSKEENLNLAAFSLFWQMMELVDGIEVLISHSVPSACTPLLRSMFEVFLSMEYILEDKSTYRERSFAWIINHATARKAIYESLLPETASGKDFSLAIEADKTINQLSISPPPEKIKRAIENLENFLDREQFSETIDAYKKAGNRAKWYSLTNGPKNLRKLAQHLNRNATYDFLYRAESDI